MTLFKIHPAHIAACGAVLLFSACGPNLAFLAERSQSEAQILQESCRKAGLQGQQITHANALMQESTRLSTDGKPEKARLASEEATGLYRVALASDNKEKAEKDLVVAESALAKDKERLTTYKEILDEVKTMRKP
jgi:hypothetical protein